MAKEWICTVCGYVAEGENPPAKCPQCGAPASKFEELDKTALLQFVTEHKIGEAKGTGEEMIKDLNAHSKVNARKSACILLCRARPTARAIPKSPRHSSVTLGKRQNMLQIR